MSFDRIQPPLVFGEVLFDCFQDGSTVLGGAPFNVAWHLQAFGAGPVFISRVGKDPLGERIEQAMTARGMITLALQRDPSHHTGTVQVKLSGGEPSYEIVDDVAWDHIDAVAVPPMPSGGLLYHGSLATRQADSADALRTLRGRLDPAVFVDVNLRDPWWNKSQLQHLLEGASWVKLNAAELELLAPDGDDLESRAQRLRERYGLRCVFATMGPDGALAISGDERVDRVAPAASVEVVDAVGAGDGFAAVLILGLLRSWSMADTLERAQAFASAIVGRRGATVDDPDFYAPFIDHWSL
jgi:fructokinase